MEELKYIYIQNIEQALSRLKVTKEFLEIYLNSSKQAYLESAILQLRKTLELLAFAAIAPNKTEYAKFRLKAESRNRSLAKVVIASSSGLPVQRLS